MTANGVEPVNGGIQVELTENIWDGRQMEIRTQNGGVTAATPAHYSANIQAETRSGRVQSDFPGMADDSTRPRRMELNLGAGGPLIHVSTTNGRVRLKPSETQ